MPLRPTITFRGIRRSPSLEADIRTRVGKLESSYRSIMGCRVLVELVQRRHEAGNRYRVRVDLTVPGEGLVVSHAASLHASAQHVQAERIAREADLHPERKDPFVAVHEAFDIARRRLQAFAQRQRGDVKSAARPKRGRTEVIV